jgi:hypothetical protein
VAATLLLGAVLLLLAVWLAWPGAAGAAVNTDPPAAPVKLVFIHHSTGEAWLANDHGGLGVALRDNDYFVSDTIYGWGPGAIGDSTDIGHWWTWFRSPDSPTYMTALYAESGQNCGYSRLADDPGGPNEIVMFKSCFPNSDLLGSAAATPPPIADDPLKGRGAGGDTLGPQTLAPRAAVVRRGKTATLYYRITDDKSASATVTIRIATPSGTVKKRLALGLRPTGQESRARFTCKLARGSYRFTVDARDLAGNAAQPPLGSNTLTVR